MPGRGFSGRAAGRNGALPYNARKSQFLRKGDVYKSNVECRRQALAFARTAARLGNRRTAFIAHDLLWAAAGGLLDESEFAAFEACERV